MTKNINLSLLKKNSRLIVLLLLLVFFAAFTDTFWGISNWTNILNIVLDQFPPLLLIAAGMTMVIIMRGIDLSIGATVAISASLGAIVMNSTQNVALGILISLLVGIIVGVCNGVLISVVGVPPYIATISMKWILTGICLVVLNGSSVYGFPSEFKALLQSTKYNCFIISLVLIFLLAFFMEKTVFGRNVYVTGTNETAAKLSGVNTVMVTIIVFAIVGVLSSITGLMYMSFLGGVDANLGSSFPIRAIAASLIGGNAFGGGKGRVTNTIIGAFIMLVLTNGLLHMGIPAVWQQFVLGALIIISVVAENFDVKSFLKKRKKAVRQLKKEEIV